MAECPLRQHIPHSRTCEQLRPPCQDGNHRGAFDRRFGLLGHALEMAKASNVSIEINSKDVPILDGAIDMANMGIIPAGMYRNKEYISRDVNIIDVDTAIEDILYDPQTSGGLLISVKEELADKLVEDMKLNGSIEAKIIGSVKKKEEKYMTVI